MILRTDAPAPITPQPKYLDPYGLPIPSLAPSPWLGDLHADARALPAFDGFPYLVTRIGRTPLRHVALLPSDLTRSHLLHLARRQAQANQLEAALCLGTDEALYFDTSGSLSQTAAPPVGSPVTDRLALAEALSWPADLQGRRNALASFADRVSFKSGHLVGDGLEAGRPAHNGDFERFMLGPMDGIPKGMHPCSTCGERAGEFLVTRGEGNGDEKPRVIPVHCRCENHNRCAFCGGPLYSHRLSAYFWDDNLCRVTYVAAYNGLNHHCID